VRLVGDIHPAPVQEVHGHFPWSPRPQVVLGGVLAWTWLWWAVAAGLGGVEFPGVLAWVAGAAGAPLAVVLVVRRSPPVQRRQFLRRLVAVRPVPARWWLAALAIGLGPKAAAFALTAAAGHEPTGDTTALAAIPALLAFLVVAVWIEEPLWRGVALDSVVLRHGVTSAAAGIGLVWALWHVPLFWLEGTYQHELGAGSGDSWLFLANIVGLSVLLTWLVVASRGFVSLAVAAHLAGNLLGELAPDDTTVVATEVVVVWFAALVVLLTARRWSGG
jgi:uncharacterized protein